MISPYEWIDPRLEIAIFQASLFGTGSRPWYGEKPIPGVFPILPGLAAVGRLRLAEYGGRGGAPRR